MKKNRENLLLKLNDVEDNTTLEVSRHVDSRFIDRIYIELIDEYTTRNNLDVIIGLDFTSLDDLINTLQDVRVKMIKGEAL